MTTDGNNYLNIDIETFDGVHIKYHGNSWIIKQHPTRGISLHICGCSLVPYIPQLCERQDLVEQQVKEYRAEWDDFAAKLAIERNYKAPDVEDAIVKSEN